jgi:trafficking protein particle complex subunit 1
MPAVSKAISPPPITSSSSSAADQIARPRSSLVPTSTTGVVVAVNEDSPNLSNASFSQPLSQTSATQSTGLSFDEEAKLVYGVVLSLRNMIKKLSGR